MSEPYYSDERERFCVTYGHLYDGEACGCCGEVAP